MDYFGFSDEVATTDQIDPGRHGQQFDGRHDVVRRPQSRPRHVQLVQAQRDARQPRGQGRIRLHGRARRQKARSIAGPSNNYQLVFRNAAPFQLAAWNNPTRARRPGTLPGALRPGRLDHRPAAHAQPGGPLRPRQRLHPRAVPRGRDPLLSTSSIRRSASHACSSRTGTRSCHESTPRSTSPATARTSSKAAGAASPTCATSTSCRWPTRTCR